MAKQKTIEVPWDVYEAIDDAVRDGCIPYTDMEAAAKGIGPNIVLWIVPYSDTAIIITPQREDQDDEDQGRTRTAGAPAGVADAPRRESVAITAHPA